MTLLRGDLPPGIDVRLVQARPADEAEILQLARLFHAEDGLVLHERGEVALRRLLADSSLGLVFKIVREPRAIGYASLCFGFSVEWGGRDAFLDDLYIDPTARGRGIGRLAVQQLGAIAKQAGCVALHLEVRPGNRAASLYKRLGFQDRGSRFLTQPLAD